jgi:anti-sigma factor RsiW
MMSEELEFQINQYADGTLSTTDAAALEDRLARDEQARQLLAEYRKLQAHLAGAMPAPAVRWDRLARHLSDAVAEAQEPVIAGRIGWGWKLAIAASVLIVIGIGLLMQRSPRSDQVKMESVAVVTGPEAEAASGPAVVEIAVGPSPALAARAASWRYAEGVVIEPSRVELAGEIRPMGLDSHIH